MAKQTITQACGHRITHDLFGPNNDRDRKAAWLKSVPCLACKRTAEQATAAPLVAGLPALTGSDKQVSWATSVRAQQLTKIAMEIERAVANCDATDPAQAAAIARIEAAVATIKQQSAAGWWIDRRDQPAIIMVRDAAK